MASRKVPLICSGHSRPVPELNYSRVTQDGFFIVSACLDGKAMLRNGETGDWIGTFVGHKGAVWSAHLDAGAVKAATGSADYTAKLWNALTGDEMHTFTHARIVKSVKFSNDDKKLLTGGQDKILRIFDLSKPDAEPDTLEGHTESIKTAIWSPNDSMIYSAAADGIRLWDTRTMKEVRRLISDNISNIELAHDKKHLVATVAKKISFFNIESLDATPVQYSSSVDCNSAALSPDAKSFVIGGVDFSVRVYDFASGKENEVLRGHHGPVHCVRFAPDGNTFASGSEDGTIRLWLSGDVRSYGLWQEKSDNNNNNNTNTNNKDH